MLKFVQKLLGIHVCIWGKWEEIKRAYSPGECCLKIVQMRTCEECGKQQLRSIESD